jgi:hypothetical protein
MKASMFYRIAAVLLLLFAVGHTLGFRQSDPKWGVDALLGSMRSIHFDVQGFNRTYWDLFVAAGFSVGGSTWPPYFRPFDRYGSSKPCSLEAM